MKLLLDENISRRLVAALQGAFPGTTQVALVGLETADDRTVWAFARQNDFVIVTKDADFADLQAIEGFPPRLVVIAIGNSANQQVLEALLRSRDRIVDAFARPDVGLVEIY